MVKFLLTIVYLCYVNYTYAQENKHIDISDSNMREVGFQPPDDLPVYKFNGHKGELISLQPVLSNHINCPFENCDSLSGKVFIQFFVHANKKISNKKIVKGIRDDIDNAAVQVIEQLECIKPASTRKRPIKYTEIIGLTIDFSRRDSLAPACRYNDTVFNKDIEFFAIFSKDSVFVDDTLEMHLSFKNNSEENMKLYPDGFICILPNTSHFITYEFADRMAYIVNDVYDYDSVVFLKPQEEFKCSFSIKADTNFFSIGENKVNVFYRFSDKFVSKKDSNIVLLSPEIRIKIKTK